MLSWIRNLVSRRLFVSSRPSTSLRSGIVYCNNLAEQTMHSEDSETQLPDDKIALNICYEGEIWVLKVDSQQLISEIINMAICHFFESKESLGSNIKSKLISVSRKRVLNPLFSVQDAELKNNDELLLALSISTGSTSPQKLSLQDIKGPSKEEIMVATANLTKRNSIKMVPALDCQENFQSEIRKVLFSLVEASAKILAQSPDAKVIFNGIALRINAKNKKEVDKNAIKYLKDLGFTEAQARYALRLKRNRQIEAMEWLLDNSHIVKEDVEDVASTSAVSSAPSIAPDDPLYTINKLLQDIQDFHLHHFEPSPRAMEKLLAMGFSQDNVVEALRLTGNNQVAACEWLCGERDPRLTEPDTRLDKDSTLYKELISNPAIQLGLHNPKIMLAFLSILENPSSANLWLNDVDTAPVLAQVFKTYHSEKHIMVVNQQVELMRQQQQS